MRSTRQKADETAAADPNALSIKIVGAEGNEVFFKIKKTTKLNKLKVSHCSDGYFLVRMADAQNAYADRMGHDVNAIRSVSSLYVPPSHRIWGIAVSPNRQRDRWTYAERSETLGREEEDSCCKRAIWGTQGV